MGRDCAIILIIDLSILIKLVKLISFLLDPLNPETNFLFFFQQRNYFCDSQKQVPLLILIIETDRHINHYFIRIKFKFLNGRMESTCFSGFCSSVFVFTKHVDFI